MKLLQKNHLISKAFTLVELIVVIVILAILATIAFLSFNNYSTSARDSDRLSDMTNITKGLSLLYTTSGVYPIPDNHITITAGTGYSIYQGTAGSKTLNIIKMSEAKDYLDNTYYSYSTDKNRIQYSIGGYLENKPTTFNGIKNYKGEVISYSNSYNDNYYNNNDNVIPAKAGIYSLLNSNNNSSTKFLNTTFFDTMKIPVSSTRMTLFDEIIGEVNAIDYSKRYLLIKGGIVGILTESGTNSPIEQTTNPGTTIDLLSSNKNLILNTSSNTTTTGNNIINGTGLIIGIIQSNQNGNYSITQPSTCPTGFIPVPGNSDFNQPGFCVAKYEMKQATGDAGSWNSLSGAEGPLGLSNNPYCSFSSYCSNITGIATINTKGAIISKPDGYPIVWLNQYNAIEACKSMGVGYHLVTNNEWMTIARDIESQSSNWSGGIIGTTINRGQSNALWADGSTGALTADLGEYGIPNTGFINKRTHNLSNGQIIWDISGNVWEHINKVNTIDGGNYNAGTNGIDNISPKNDICNSADSFYLWPTCSSRGQSLYGPKNNSYTNTNGMGIVWDYDASIHLRGGSWNLVSNAGIYTFFLGWNAPTAGGHVSFRCAK